MTAQPIAVLSYVKTQYVSSFKCQQELVMKCDMTQAKNCELFTCRMLFLKFYLDTYN